MLSLIVCPLLVLLAVAAALSEARADERRLVLAGLAAHVLGSVAIVVYHQRAGGDMLVYHDVGLELSHLVQRDSRYFADVVKLGLHLDNDLPVELFAGTSSGTMCALMALFITVVGDNLYAICLASSLFAFLGQLSMFRSGADKLEEVERKPILVAFMLLPSVVFWTSGFIKEAFVVGFLGLLCRGFTRLITGRGIARALVEAFVGVMGTVTLKPYILFPLVLGVAGWLATSRSSKLGGGVKLLAIAAALGVVFAMTRAFPEYGAGLAASVNRQQLNYDLISSSNIDIGDIHQDPDDATLGGQLRYFPLALVNALARPMIFEARNASVVVASLEMTVLLLLALSLAKSGARSIVREIRGRPPLMFAAIFVLSFSVAVGLTTRNLGTLSRYRVPAFPIYVGLVVALRARLAKSRQPSATGRSASPKSPKGRRLAPAPKRRAA